MKVTFAPQLTVKNGLRDVDFYIKAFNAVEIRRFSNDDGTIHVSELAIGGSLFHIHEQTKGIYSSSPDALKGSTVVIGLFVDDVHAVVGQAVAAGAIVVSPVQDYDYGYRQGQILDPFGHHWLIEKAI